MELAQGHTLNNNLEDFLRTVTDGVQRFGDTVARKFTSKELAKLTGKSTRTVSRYLTQLEDKGLVEVRKKRGHNGGITMAFNLDEIDFPVNSQVFKEDTQTIDEIHEEFFPKSDRPEPKRKYRSREVTAEENLRKRKREGHLSEINDKIEELGYPTKEVFMMFPDPEKAIKGWVLSRMYDLFPVQYFEDEKNLAESRGEKFHHVNMVEVQKNYLNRSCLPTRFAGSWQHSCFMNLADTIDSLDDCTPATYLTTQFNYWFYLMKTKNWKAQLPWINQLYGDQAVARFKGDVDYRKGFVREHHYFDTMPNLLVNRMENNPTLYSLNTMYSNPLATSDGYFNSLLEELEDQWISEPAQVFLAYNETMQEAIKDNNALTKEEQETLSKFIKAEIAVRSKSRPLEPVYQMVSVFPILKRIKAYESGNHNNYRELYSQLGRTRQQNTYSPVERATNVKSGYGYYLSTIQMRDNLNTWKAIRSIKGYDVDLDTLNQAIEKIGKNKIPLSEFGELEMHDILLEKLSKEEIIEDYKRYSYNVETVEELDEVLNGEYWYDVQELHKLSTRDGRLSEEIPHSEEYSV